MIYNKKNSLYSIPIPYPSTRKMQLKKKSQLKQSPAYHQMAFVTQRVAMVHVSRTQYFYFHLYHSMTAPYSFIHLSLTQS